MSICPAKALPHEMKKTMIKVFSYDKKCMQGTIFNPFYGKEIAFDNIIQMIFMIEHISDSLLYPQRAMQLRKFQETEVHTDKFPFDFEITTDYSDLSPIASFELEILFRQNASWQGNLIYAEKNSISSFRSVLELITLLDSALNNK